MAWRWDTGRAKMHRQKWEQIIDAFFKNCCRNGIETAWLRRRTHYDFPSLIFRTRPKIWEWRDGGEQYLWQPMTTRGAANRLDLLAEELEKSISCQNGRRWRALVRITTQDLGHRFPHLATEVSGIQGRQTGFSSSKPARVDKICDNNDVRLLMPSWVTAITSLTISFSR